MLFIKDSADLKIIFTLLFLVCTFLCSFQKIMAFARVHVPRALDDMEIFLFFTNINFWDTYVSLINEFSQIFQCLDAVRNPFLVN